MIRSRAQGWTSEEVLRALHEQVVVGDHAAIDSLCAILLPDLRAHLERLFPGTDRHDIETVANDTLLCYLRTPCRFDQRRGLFSAWIRTVAANRMRDLRRQVHRRARREVPSGLDLSWARLDWQQPGRAPTGEDEVNRRVIVLSLARTDQERRFLEARLSGGPTDVQARALEIQDLPREQQRRVIYRVLDRIIKQAQRVQRR